MQKKQQGFTLIEIAIVLVIIGLLLGGVLKGQELIQNARVRNIISQQDGVKAAFFGFQDRYRGIPGDYPATSATANIPGAGSGSCGGDGDSILETTGTVAEFVCAWYHLSKSGFITGSYSGSGTTASPTNSPANPFGGLMQIVHDAVYADVATAASTLNIKTGTNIPATTLAEVDRKLDDGSPDTGNFRYSAWQIATAGCYTASSAGPPVVVGAWAILSTATQCGGATLF